MKVFNNEITIHRGETFSMDKVIQNKDGSPYIVSRRLKNPCVLVSVSTTRYAQDERYKLNKWLRLAETKEVQTQTGEIQVIVTPLFAKVFDSTEPFDLKSLMADHNGTTPHYPNGFTDITERKYAVDDTGQPLLDKDGKEIGYYIAEGWLGDEHVWYDFDDCVFYVEDDEGVRDYRYWDLNTNGWVKYEFRITCPFTQAETSQWIEQSYVYSITLVSGEWNNNRDEKDPPFSSFDSVQPLLIPIKLSVLSSINGGF